MQQIDNSRSNSNDSQFLTSVNQCLASIAQQVSTDYDFASASRAFWRECAREQLKCSDPKARSFGLVHQWFDTCPRAW